MVQHVTGKKNDKKVHLWGLSTCMWCKKTKKLLDDNSVDYTFEFVDLLGGEEQDNVLKEIEKCNPAVSFPTIIIDGKCIVGFDEKRIREALGL
jgi:glutaredoxin